MATPVTLDNIGDFLEQYTYEYLLMMGLSHVPDSIDKRQGSIIWDAIAPCAYVMAELVVKMRQIYKDTFVATASGDYLDLLAAEVGLQRYEATFAVKKGYFYDTYGALMDVPDGGRYAARNNSNSLVYAVTSATTGPNDPHETGVYLLTCETAGRIGNQYYGDLVPITNVPGLGRAVLADTIISARDRETDDELRQRIYDKVNEKPFGGNVAQYKVWTQELDGVGAAQIYPIWNGGGTVKISILDNDFLPASDETVAIVQHAIDPQDILADPIIRYYSGNPVSFSTEQNRINNVTVTGRPRQLGTGTPSDTNVREIQGVRQSPSINIDGTTWQLTTGAKLYSIPVPGGTQIVDTITKTNNVDLAQEIHATKLVTLTGAETGWRMFQISTSYMFALSAADAKLTPDNLVNTLSSHFPALTAEDLESGDRGVAIVDRNGPCIALVFVPGMGVNSLATFQTWMSGKGVQVLYELQESTLTNQTGIDDITNPTGTVVITADDDAPITVGVIDHTTTSQLGLGIAPIGHKVTVVTPNQFMINVTATIVLSEGFDVSSVQNSIENSIQSYFTTVREGWGNASDLNLYHVVVYQSLVIAQILAVPGVISVTTCLLNGASSDVILREDSLVQQIPELGEVNLSA